MHQLWHLTGYKAAPGRLQGSTWQVTKRECLDGQIHSTEMQSTLLLAAHWSIANRVRPVLRTFTVLS